MVIYTAGGELDGPTSESQVPSTSALPSEAVKCPAALRSTSSSLSCPAPGDGTILPVRRTAAPLVNLMCFLERACGREEDLRFESVCVADENGLEAMCSASVGNNGKSDIFLAPNRLYPARYRDYRWAGIEGRGEELADIFWEPEG